MRRRAILAPLLLAAVAGYSVGCSDASSPEIRQPVETMPVGTNVGDVAPGFALAAPDGSTVTLAGYRGKVVLVDFWGTWCAPCRAAIPELKRIWERYRSRGFVILSVAVAQNPTDWRSVISSEGLDWAHGIDSDQIAIRKYDVIGVPTTYLLDTAGRVVAKNVSGSSLENELDKLLK